MKFEFDYNQVDWKAVRAGWGKSAIHFQLVIIHRGNELTFETVINERKKIILFIVVNGSFEGMYLDEGHPFYKYLNKKEVLMSRKHIVYLKNHYRKYRKLSTREIMKKENIRPFVYGTPGFDNITQVKKMVDRLLALDKAAVQ